MAMQELVRGAAQGLQPYIQTKRAEASKDKDVARSLEKMKKVLALQFKHQQALDELQFSNRLDRISKGLSEIDPSMTKFAGGIAAGAVDPGTLMLTPGQKETFAAEMKKMALQADLLEKQGLYQEAAALRQKAAAAADRETAAYKRSQGLNQLLGFLPGSKKNEYEYVRDPVTGKLTTLLTGQKTVYDESTQKLIDDLIGSAARYYGVNYVPPDRSAEQETIEDEFPKVTEELVQSWAQIRNVAEAASRKLKEDENAELTGVERRALNMMIKLRQNADQKMPNAIKLMNRLMEF